MIAKHKLLKTVLSVLLAVLTGLGCVILLSIHQCRTELTVSYYSVETNLYQPIRIVQLTDLHSWTFGDNNALLVDEVLKQKPDIVVMTGDMLDKSDKDASVVCSLIQRISEKVPVWYGYGNHEKSWMETTGQDLTPALTEAGAAVINCEYLDIQIKGQPLRIGGYHGYYRQPGMYKIPTEQRQAELDFAVAFESSDCFKLLLCHIPTPWLDWGYIDKFPVDLVLTGHYHGGQIRIPLLGGLYAPYIGFFPEYTEGMYSGQKAVCVLSTGLGSSPGIPRINNLPEITVIDLVPKK